MQKSFNHIVTSILIINMLGGCSSRSKEPDSHMEQVVLYTARDTLIKDKGVSMLVPTAERNIYINRSLALMEKVQRVADSLSVHHFNGLKIHVIGIDTLAGNGVIAKIDLMETTAPGTSADEYGFDSWYDYFQGSYGGQHTAISLRETMLQPDYQGEWIDGIAFYYQGEPIGIWDHFNLSGIQHR